MTILTTQNEQHPNSVAQSTLQHYLNAMLVIDEAGILRVQILNHDLNLFLRQAFRSDIPWGKNSTKIDENRKFKKLQYNNNKKALRPTQCLMATEHSFYLVTRSIIPHFCLVSTKKYNFFRTFLKLLVS